MADIKILLIEDNLGDIRLTREAFKDARIKNELSVVTDGEEAILYLKKIGQYKDVDTPDLILLDLNLPKKDGREVLKEIKSDSLLKNIPVVILTISLDNEGLLGSYSSDTNCFITKPVDSTQFLNVIRSIEDFWLNIIRIPETEDKMAKI